MDKDRSIIIQVAAKIASELTGNTSGMNTEETVNRFTLLFVDIKDVMLDSIYGASAQVEAAVQTIESSFGEVTTVTPSNMPQEFAIGVKVRGKQHGELPNWLVVECKKSGISEVFDNRDGLAQNAKRPWFKATAGDKAFWPPKGS